MELLPFPKELIEWQDSVRQFAILLNPVKFRPSEFFAEKLEVSKSKVGGVPNVANFDTYPCCTVCGKPLQLLAQLYKKDLPLLYTPEGKDLLQIFICPAYACFHANYLTWSDRQFINTQVYFFKNVGIKEAPAESLYIPSDSADGKPMPEYELVPELIYDYPGIFEYPKKWTEYLRGEMIRTGIDFHWDFFSREGFKLNGYPQWVQDADVPVCGCGNKKELFFQFGQPDVDLKLKKNEYYEISFLDNYFSMYFFVCKKCGESTVETRFQNT